MYSPRSILSSEVYLSVGVWLLDHGNGILLGHPWCYRGLAGASAYVVGAFMIYGCSFSVVAYNGFGVPVVFLFGLRLWFWCARFLPLFFSCVLCKSVSFCFCGGCVLGCSWHRCVLIWLVHSIVVFWVPPVWSCSVRVLFGRFPAFFLLVAFVGFLGFAAAHVLLCLEQFLLFAFVFWLKGRGASVVSLRFFLR